MRAKTDRCGTILDLIDRCLTDYESGGCTAPRDQDVTTAPPVIMAAHHDARLVDA